MEVIAAAVGVKFQIWYKSQRTRQAANKTNPATMDSIVHLSNNPGQTNRVSIINNFRIHLVLDWCLHACMQLRAMKGAFSNANYVNFFFMVFPQMSLNCKIVSVQQQEYKKLIWPVGKIVSSKICISLRKGKEIFYCTFLTVYSATSIKQTPSRPSRVFAQERFITIAQCLLTSNIQRFFCTVRKFQGVND